MLSFMTKTSHSNNLQTMTTGLVGKCLLTTIRVVFLYCCFYQYHVEETKNYDMLPADMKQQFSEGLSIRYCSSVSVYKGIKRVWSGERRVTLLRSPSRKPRKVNPSALPIPSQKLYGSAQQPGPGVLT